MSPSLGTPSACNHCGLPVPQPLWLSGANDPDDEGSQFCCLGCRIAAAINDERRQTGAPRTMLLRLVLGVFFSMSVMVFTFALWSYDVYGVDADDPRAAMFVSVLRYVVLMFATPVLLLLGGPMADAALHQLRRGVPTTDLLLLIGVAAAFAYSLTSVIRGTGAVYFETACMILVFVTFGRWLEAAGRHHAATTLDRLARLIPETAHLVRDSKIADVPIAEVCAGDLLEIRPGERFPTDGVVNAGVTSADEQLFTGESWPAVKGVGDRVLGGTLNLDGCPRVQSTAAPDAGTLARMLDALQEARRRQGASQRLADRMSRWFLPVIAVVASGSFAVQAVAGDPGGGLLSALAVVLIACPCALGIATPLAVWVALCRAAEQNVLFRSGAALEKLAGVRAVCFDKTGTLTRGTVSVGRIVTQRPQLRAESLARAAALAGRTNHPLGRAIVGLAEAAGADPPVADSIVSVAGQGVRGSWPGEQTPTLLGSRRFLTGEAGFEIGPELRSTIGDVQARGNPLALIGWDQRVQGVFEFREELRHAAAPAIAALHDAQLQVQVLTGDHAARGRQLAEQLDVPVLSELLPDAKVDAVRQMQCDVGPTAMVGDGVNDAAAMTTADVGVAMGCGADLTRDNAEVCLLSDDLERLPWALSLARDTVRTVRTNIWWAFGYNSVGVVLAAAGWLHPSVAALLMVVSSLAVIANSLRLGRRYENPESADRNTNQMIHSDFEIRQADVAAEAVQ